jgi:hypothetical protein
LFARDTISKLAEVNAAIEPEGAISSRELEDTGVPQSIGDSKFAMATSADRRMGAKDCRVCSHRPVACASAIPLPNITSPSNAIVTVGSYALADRRTGANAPIIKQHNRAKRRGLTACGIICDRMDYCGSMVHPKYYPPDEYDRRAYGTINDEVHSGGAGGVELLTSACQVSSVMRSPGATVNS